MKLKLSEPFEVRSVLFCPQNGSDVVTIGITRPVIVSMGTRRAYIFARENYLEVETRAVYPERRFRVEVDPTI